MAATVQDIRGWLAMAQDKGATHMIVACDTYDWSDYPVFVMPGEDAREISERHEKVMECYAMHLSIEAQLGEHRAFHFDGPKPKRKRFKIRWMLEIEMEPHEVWGDGEPPCEPTADAVRRELAAALLGCGNDPLALIRDWNLMGGKTVPFDVEEVG